jgi:predicted RNA-binding protein
MTHPNYWIDLFTGTTWREFLDAGAKVSGFREKQWKTVQKINRGDYLLCYLVRIKRFVGILQVISEPFKDNTPIWQEDPFAARVRVATVTMLTPETAVPIVDMKNHVSILARSDWEVFFQRSPTRMKKASDGEAIAQTLMAAAKAPVVRPLPMLYPIPKPLTFDSKAGRITVPDLDAAAEVEQAPAKDVNLHTEIQWLLAKLGNDMGLDVWVARNDRNREVARKHFTDLPRLRAYLPHQVDEATNRTIELIDVLWVEKHSIVAAFEIESTTTIYSGLLRMSDLISMLPRLTIPLFIVAPDDRRQKIIAEVNRPTFSMLSPPMSQVCRFIAFSTLKAEVSKVGRFAQHLKPDFINELAESCEIEDV